MTSPRDEVLISYTNWRQERRERRVLPLRMWVGTSPWHSERQWFVQATDCETGEQRDFALKDIHSWKPTT